jgi:hypothetical protein
VGELGVLTMPIIPALRILMEEDLLHSENLPQKNNNWILDIYS